MDKGDHCLYFELDEDDKIRSVVFHHLLIGRCSDILGLCECISIAICHSPRPCSITLLLFCVRN